MKFNIIRNNIINPVLENVTNIAKTLRINTKDFKPLNMSLLARTSTRQIFDIKADKFELSINDSPLKFTSVLKINPSNVIRLWIDKITIKNLSIFNLLISTW